MGKIGYGYGSEWHLLRHLGYHRAYFSEKVISIIGGQDIEWLDFEFSQANAPLKDDREFTGLEFIKDTQVREKWKSFWPQTGNAHNWDTIGKIYFGNTFEWLLVEAKGHIGEIVTKCKATSPENKKVIYSSLEKTSKAFGNYLQPIKNWIDTYYQYANRLAVLYFLMKECVPSVNARLLFVYFFGENRENLKCPQSEQDWESVIRDIEIRLGIDKNSELAQRTHCLFLPINPAGVGFRIKSNRV